MKLPASQSLHTLAPASAANFPAAHGEQDATFPIEYVPFRQISHPDAAAAETVPWPHAAQKVLPASTANLPSEQLWQPVAAGTSENIPGEHRLQDASELGARPPSPYCPAMHDATQASMDVDAIDRVPEPAGHTAQSGTPAAAAYVPRAQAWQAFCPVSPLESYPGMHGVQAVDWLSAVAVPAGHGSHRTEKLDLAKVPGAHSWQEEDASADFVPAGQAVHDACPAA